MSKDNVTRRISIFVNGKEVENSLKGVEGAMAQVRNRMRLLNSDSETYDKDSKELAQTMNQLRERQAAYREELGLTNKTMQEANEISGGLRGTLTGIWDSLVSGDLQGAKEGISSLTSGIGGLLKSSLAFIATPFGATIAGLAGLAAGAKAMFDFNVQAEKGAQLIENLSGKTGQVVEDIRVKMQSLVDTFDVEFEGLAGAVDNLVDTGVAKDELEALDQIKQGLLTAPDKNEFISSLENTSVIAKQVGADLGEVIGIKKAIEETGVNPEATFGALQKAGLNLSKQTSQLRDEMVAAFGAAFTDDVLNKVKTGQITTVQALDLINTKSKEVSLNQKQQAELGSQIFGKAAVAAGGYATVLDTVSTGLKKNKEELNGNQKALDELEKANLKLNKAQSELFRVKDFGELWTKIKVLAIDAFASLLEYISEVKKDAQPLIDLIGVVFVAVWENLKFTVTSAFDIIGGVVKSFVSYFTGIIQFWKKLLTGDFKGAFIALADGIGNAFKYIGNIFISLYNNAVKLLQGIVDVASPLLETLGIDVDKLQKKLEGFKGKKFEIKGEIKTTTTNETKNTTTNTPPSGNGGGGATKDALAVEQKARADAAAKQKAEEEKQAKEAYDRAKALADAKANLAKVQLDAFIANQRSFIEKDKALTPEILAMEEDRLDTIRNKKNESALNEFEKKKADLIAKAQLEKTSQEQLNIELETLNIEYNQKKLENDLEFQKLTEEQKNQYEQEQAVLKAEQLALDNELAIAEAETKAEAEKIKQEQDYQAELQRYAKLYADKKITDEEYARFKEAAKQKQEEMDRVRDLQQLQGTLGGLNTIAGAIGEMFGQSKELAIVQAGINGAMAVTSILAQYPKFDGGFAMWATIAAAGITTVAQIAKIASAKPPKSPKFFYGGNTGDKPALGYDEFGPVTGYVHKNEYVIPEVMTQDPRFANTIGWLEANRQSKMRGYVDGGATSPGVVGANTVETSSNETAMLINAVNNLNAILSSGIMAKVNFGYKDVENLEEMKNDISTSSQNGIIG